MPLTRLATLEDLTRLAEPLSRLPLFERYGPPEAATLRDRWEAARLRGDSLWVAEEAGGPMGLAWFTARGAFGLGAYLRTLVLVPTGQARGLGALLLQRFESETQDAPGGWFALASDFNEGAHRFYRRHGYAEVGRLPGLVVPDVSELLLWKARSRPRGTI